MLSPLVLIAVVGLLALGGAVALVYYIGKGSGKGRARTTWLCAGLAVVLAVAFGLLNVVSVFYVKPLGLLVALGAVVAIAVGLFVRIGMDVGWGRGRVVALVGFVVTTGLVLLALGLSNVGGGLVQPLFEMRARQIAEANGFTALLPTHEDLPTDYRPVEPLEAPEKGLSLGYDDFRIHERKASEGSTIAGLRKLVAPGERPMGPDMPPIPLDAEALEVMVRDQPAFVVTYSVQPNGNAKGASKRTDTTVLVLVRDGVDVRMISESGERESKGEWVPYSALTGDELRVVAEGLEPVGS